MLLPSSTITRYACSRLGRSSCAESLVLGLLCLTRRALLLGTIGFCLVAAVPVHAASPKVAKPTTKVWAAVSSESMRPTFPLNALVEMELGVPFAELKTGDTVIFWDTQRGARCLTHHRLIAHRGGGWITQGDNKKTNPVADRTWVTSDNYIARTTGRYTQFLAVTPAALTGTSGG